jgi:hypothetical protein
MGNEIQLAHCGKMLHDMGESNASSAERQGQRKQFRNNESYATYYTEPLMLFAYIPDAVCIQTYMRQASPWHQRIGRTTLSFGKLIQSVLGV